MINYNIDCYLLPLHHWKRSSPFSPQVLHILPLNYWSVETRIKLITFVSFKPGYGVVYVTNIIIIITLLLFLFL